ncbi:uncharacterized protein Bfra_011319 [Botrytis fragariae]|uniref:Uncharacterized protein n=1 Tax=Botrytis fragariae TaxID=1964551 RepID=A0A8H6ALL3_9HELO|nr:uncharacterized protein Bfra_011319 [Botrytis fragariae]KAF5869510.1 hypothetical protein Bfra_011319 [Botrytis fragariae]
MPFSEPNENQKQYNANVVEVNPSCLKAYSSSFPTLLFPNPMPCGISIVNEVSDKKHIVNCVPDAVRSSPTLKAVKYPPRYPPKALVPNSEAQSFIILLHILLSPLQIKYPFKHYPHSQLNRPDVKIELTICPHHYLTTLTNLARYDL